MRMGAGDPRPGPTGSWVTLGALARETSRIGLGTLVTSATFGLPGLLAIAVAQVDAMSGGRVELGLGAGWFEPEHDAYGVPFPPLGERFDRLTEQLDIVTGLWTTPLGALCGFIVQTRPRRRMVWASMVAAVRVSSPRTCGRGGGPGRAAR
jgi:alkanesulfonate monooxygenase SsuD/methylene tetrahydromethanopterin reductase-like flavin-dependent oxidoreductase (luciferase family)